MQHPPMRLVVAALACAGLAAAAQADVRVRNAAGTDPAAAPFPADRWTVPDATQATLRRVALPKPDCALRPTDCADLDVINALDGFSTQPRITVPFDGDIDIASVDSTSVYLVNLGGTLSGAGLGARVGVNQVQWDAGARTLVVESDQLLAETTRWLLVVTDRVRDAEGRPVKAAKWLDAPTAAGADLRAALRSVPAADAGRVVAASLFTTQTSTGDLVKVMRRIKQTTPAPVDFLIGSAAEKPGPVRAVFSTATLQGIQFRRQTGTAPVFTPSSLPTALLQIVPGAIGALAYGRFESPSYLGAGNDIPPTPTLTGAPAVQGARSLIVQLMLPSGPRPAGGWPVAIFGHGFGDSMYGAPWTVASTFASRGIATLAINVVGHGGGALGTLNVQRSDGAPVVAVPAGGRGFDQDGNGNIDGTEGVNAAPPRSAIGSRDGLRQTTIDLMQLVRQVETGVDIDGDGSADLDGTRIYYTGQSFGGIYGTILLGVEPSLKAGVPNVPGGSITELARLGAFRGLTAATLGARQPSLLNGPTPGTFVENVPLRDLPPQVNNVPGASAIQLVLDRLEWVQQSGNPVSYAPLIRTSPVPGSAPKPIILQFAKGDQTVPNPSSTAIVRAGALQPFTTYFRNDLAYALNPAVPKNPHTFLSNVANPALTAYALGAQQQIALFFASGGTQVIDPDGNGPIFEVPIQLPLPEGLNFIP